MNGVVEGKERLVVEWLQHLNVLSEEIVQQLAVQCLNNARLVCEKPKEREKERDA